MNTPPPPPPPPPLLLLILLLSMCRELEVAARLSYPHLLADPELDCKMLEVSRRSSAAGLQQLLTLRRHNPAPPRLTVDAVLINCSACLWKEKN